MERIIFSGRWIFFLCIAFNCYTIKGQSKLLSSDYDRNSISLLLLKTPADGDKSLLEDLLKEHKLGEEFFENKLRSSIFSVDINRIPREEKIFNVLKASNLGDLTDKFGLALGRKLTEKNIGGQILTLWSHQDADGSFDTLQRRIEINLTGENIRAIENKNKIDNFKGLFSRNFVLIFDFKEIITYAEHYQRINAKVDKIPRGYVGYVDIYAYRLEMPEELFQGHVKLNFDKPAVLASYPYKFEFLGFRNVTIFSEQTVYQDSEGNTRYSPADDRGIYKNLVSNAFEKGKNAFEKLDFGVKASIVASNPIQVEIGKKEGVYTDQRYFVNEYVQKGESVTLKKVGVIRARKVTDNRKDLLDAYGNTKRTTFYQVSGKNLKEGMILEEKNDLGLSIAAGVGGSLDNSYEPDRAVVRLDVNTGRLFSVPGLKIYVELDFLLDEELQINDEETPSYLGLGLSKNLNVSRWISLAPYAGYHFMGISEEEKSNGEKAKGFGKIGVRVPLMISHFIFIEPDAGFIFGENKGPYPTNTPVNLTLRASF